MYKNILALLLTMTTAMAFRLPKSQDHAKGKEAYETYCVACHQADGLGQKGINPPLVNSDWVRGDKQRLIKTVLKGMSEPIEIEGVKYTNAMPAHDWLEDKELADLLSYVRQHFGKVKDEITVEEVKAARQ